MKKIFIIICFFAFSIPTAHAFGMKSTMDKLLNGWLGYNIDNVIDQWGYPSKTDNIAGRKLYYWNDNGGSSYVKTSNYSGYFIDYYCNCIFEVNDENIITKWQWEGTSCPSTYLGVKKYVNPQNNYWEKKKKR